MVRIMRADRDVDGRAVSVAFLPGKRVLVLTDDGELKILTQLGMVDVWEELWRQTGATPGEAWGWERV